MDPISRTGLALAAGAFTLLSTEGAEAVPAVQLPQERFDVTVSNNDTLTNVYLLYKDDTVPIDSTLKLQKEIKGNGDPQTFSFIGPGSTAIHKTFMLIGEYSTSGGTGGLFLMTSNAIADVLIQHKADFGVEGGLKEISDSDLKFDTELKLDQVFIKWSELKLTGAMETGATDTLFSFFSDVSSLLDTQFNTQGSLVEFSTASPGGDVTITETDIPEPGVLASFGTALAGLFGGLARRRR